MKLFDRDTFLHLRLPFSFFLLPIFIFSISQSTVLNWLNIILIFIVLHFLIYPASNAYNSYNDKDTGSIGGLKTPPPVTKKLFYASVVLDTLGLLLSLFINWQMVFLILVYICISKAYSWKSIRLKRYGFLGWLVVMLFQGGYTFLLVNMASENLFTIHWFTQKHIECMAIASLLIGGFYPFTQIYQHDEDSKWGDFTISYRLGIIGTFVFSGALFLAACALAYYYFYTFYSASQFAIFILCLVPVIVYYFYWLRKVIQNKAVADYTHTMRMVIISSSCMIICFGIIFFSNHS